MVKAAMQRNRPPRQKRDIQRHKQPMGVEDRQGVDQHILRGELPQIAQRLGVRGQVAMRQHRPL